jgi:hypothetical protein
VEVLAGFGEEIRKLKPADLALNAYSPVSDFVVVVSSDRRW